MSMGKLAVFGYLVGAVLLAGLAGGVYYRFQESRKAPLATASAKVTLVSTEPVKLGTVRDELTLVGTVEPLTLVDVRSKVAGRIDMLGVDENDTVEAGKTVLAEIDRETYAAQLDQAKAAVSAAEAAVAIGETTVRQVEKDYQRAENLFKEGAATEQIRDQAKAQFDGARSQKQAAEAQLAQAKAAVRLAEIQYKESQVIAPVSGIVLKKYQDAGNMTAPTAPNPLFTIGEIRQVKVTAGLSERYLGSVREGTTAVSICSDGSPESACTAKLARISPIVDPLTRTGKIEAIIPNDQLELKPGMYVRMAVVVEEHANVPVLSADAVVSNHAGQCVFVVAGGTAHRRDVKLGIRENDVQEILEGLQPGELVVIRGQTNLEDGSPVKLVGQGEQP